MRRSTFLKIFLILLALVLLVGFLPNLISRNVVIAALKQNYEQVTGTPISVTARAVPGFFTSPAFKLSDITITTIGPSIESSIVSMEAMKIRFSWSALWSAELDIETVELVRPRFLVDIREDGRNNWWLDTPTRTDSAALRAGLTNLRITDGILYYKNARSGQRDAISDIDLDYQRPTSDNINLLQSTFKWRGDPLTLQARWPLPANPGSQQTDLQLRDGFFSVNGVPLKLRADFTLRPEEDVSAPWLQGTLNASTPSLRSLLVLTGFQVNSQQSAYGAAALQASLSYDGRQLTLSEARLEVDGNQAEGQITLSDPFGHNALSARLASQTVDISAYWPDFHWREWITNPQTEPDKPAPLQDVHLDFPLWPIKDQKVTIDWQTQRLRWHDKTFRQVDLSFQADLAEGQTLTLHQATLMNGTISGQWQWTQAAPSVSTVLDAPIARQSLSLNWRNIVLQDTLWKILKGQMQGEALIVQQQRKGQDSARPFLYGKASVTFNQTRLEGVDARVFFQSLFALPVSRDVRDETLLEDLQADLAFSSYQTQLTARFATKGLQGQLQGHLDPVLRQWDMTGHMRFKNEQNAPSRPFTVTGPLLRPVIFPGQKRAAPQ
jgi:hypothetical protein